MHASSGILTSQGGMTSHAAVVARGMGRPCVSGAGEVRIDVASGKVFIGDAQLKDGDMITVDGGVGEIYQGEIAKIQPRLSGAFEVLMGWADSLRRMKVRTNAETPADARMARDFGAEGIGLCRTEHMFFDADRIVTMREMIMASDSAGRQAALDRLLPMQRQDFIELFEIMSGLPVTIRLLDPPLHEFLPHSDTELEDVARSSGISLETARQRALRLKDPTRCWGIGAAGWRSPILRFVQCRLEQFLKLRCTWPNRLPRRYQKS